jgi:hypothetical protein
MNDYKALIAVARGYRPVMSSSRTLIRELADALEALVKERDAAQRVVETHACAEYVELAYRRTLEAQRERDAEREKFRAERDALRARFDSMTTETRRATRGHYYTDDFQINIPDEVQFEASAFESDNDAYRYVAEWARKEALREAADWAAGTYVNPDGNDLSRVWATAVETVVQRLRTLAEGDIE